MTLVELLFAFVVGVAEGWCVTLTLVLVVLLVTVALVAILPRDFGLVIGRRRR